MTDSHDNEAAGRAAAFLAAWDRYGPQDIIRGAQAGGGVRRELTTADLRAVLAENKTMRQQLTGLKVVWESIYSNDEYDTKAEALAAATKDRFGTPAVDEDVTWRLVGEWQPAERDE